MKEDTSNYGSGKRKNRKFDDEPHILASAHPKMQIISLFL